MHNKFVILDTRHDNCQSCIACAVDARATIRTSGSTRATNGIEANTETGADGHWATVTRLDHEAIPDGDQEAFDVIRHAGRHFESTRGPDADMLPGIKKRQEFRLRATGSTITSKVHPTYNSAVIGTPGALDGSRFVIESRYAEEWTEHGR